MTLGGKVWLACVPAVFIVVLLPSSSPAADVVWEGDQDGNWNADNAGDTNWVGDVLPSGGDTLLFGGESNTSTTNDFGAGTMFGGIQFTNDGGTGSNAAFTLGGNSLVLGGDITSTAITSGTLTDEISLDLELDATRTIDLGTDHDLIMSGIVSQSGSNRGLIKEGDGTLTLTRANTITGTTELREGTTVIEDSAAFGTGQVQMEIGTAPVLELGADSLSVANEIFVRNQGGSKTIRLDSGGAGHSGTLTGDVLINEVTADAFTLDAGVDDSLELTGLITTTAGGGAGIRTTGDGTVIFNGSQANDYLGDFVLGNGASTFDGTNGVKAGFVVTHRGDAFGSGTIISQGGQLRAGVSGIDIPNAIQIDGGGFRLGGTNDFEFSGDVELIGGNRAVGHYGLDGVTYTLSGNFELNGSILVFEGSGGADNGRYDVSGTISNGAVQVSGSFGNGDVVFTGANTYSGTTDIDGGTLRIGNGGTTGSLGSGNVENDGNLVFNRSDSVTVANVISGSGDLRQVGSGTLTITGANSYSGETSLEAGTTVITNQGGFGTGLVNLRGDSTLELDADGMTIANDFFVRNPLDVRTLRLDRSGTNSAAITGGFTINEITQGDFVLDVGADDTLNLTGNLETTGGGGAGIRKTGSGSLIITGTNNYLGVTDIDAGTLQIGDGGTTGTFGADAVENAATLVFDRTDSFTVSNQISGSGTLTQQGTGTLTLDGNNTYTGTTTVADGTLALSSSTLNSTIGSSSTILVESGAELDVTGITASGGFEVGNGQTLGGTGTVTGDTTIASGGTLSPGNSTGTETFSGDVTFDSGSTWLVELVQDVNGDADQIVVGGQLNIDPNATLDLQASGAFTQGNSYTIASYGTWNGGTFSGFADDSTFSLGGGHLQIDYDNGSAITLQAVPEPEAFLPLLAVLLPALWMVRRRARCQRGNASGAHAWDDAQDRLPPG